ncbi:MAG: response regulator transcription factor [Saprospiraceae bacterium]|nr:response regulator transcription factor [Saprospiraceae bacterium]
MAKSIKVLIVEDDHLLAQLVSIQVTALPASADIIENGWKALDQVMSHHYDLMILDLMLPGLNGLEICRKIRQVNKSLPILMLTAKSEEHDKIDGFNIGADDYLTKPFSNGELMARIKALLRRTHTETTTSDKTAYIQNHELRIDLENHQMYRNGQEIELTAKEFDLIHFFMKNPGRAFTRQQLLDEVWGPHFDGLEHTINSTINRLRSKIETDLNKPEYILTAWGVGYRFKNI